MQASTAIRLLIGVILVVALPGIGCFGWYSLGTLSTADTLIKTMVVVAYPTALISLAVLLLALISKNQNRHLVWVSGLSLMTMVAIIFIARHV